MFTEKYCADVALYITPGPPLHPQVPENAGITKYRAKCAPGASRSQGGANLICESLSGRSGNFNNLYYCKLAELCTQWKKKTLFSRRLALQGVCMLVYKLAL